MNTPSDQPARDTTDSRGAGVKFPPPLIFLLVMAAGYGIEKLTPLEMDTIPFHLPVGIFLVILGLLVVLLAANLFRKTQTAIEPWKPTSAIIETGLYRYSRNPIYTAFAIIQVGIGLALNNFWILAGTLVSLILVYLIAIRKEEAYLEEKFGADYLAYKSRVRRWL